MIRIELDVRRCAYNTQLDAVKVKGYAPISDEAAELLRQMQAEMNSNRRPHRGRARTVSCNELEAPERSSGDTLPQRIPLTNCLPAPVRML